MGWFDWPIPEATSSHSAPVDAQQAGDERMSEELAGGVANRGQVKREGERVVRPAPPNAPTLHRLLRHVTAVGFPASWPIALPGDGTEVLEFIPGEVSLPPHPEPWVREHRVLIALGRFLRAFHDATTGFETDEADRWSSEMADPLGGDVICHNDVCIENVVFRDGSPVGLLDFDFAAPGRRVWDVAMTARYWVPLLDPQSASATQREHLDPFSRLVAFVDAYGLDPEDRATFTTTLMEIEEITLAFVLRRVEAGEPAFVEMWANLGGEGRYTRKMTWLRAHLADIDRAVCV